jgi:hypothetical protein
MTQLSEAIARYHKILENDPSKVSAWTKQLREQMESRNLVAAGRPVSLVLRPHFLSRRQYINLVKTAECLNSAIDRARSLALSSPALLARMELLPAEKMLAALDPGYPYPSITSLLDTQVNNGTVHAMSCSTDLPSGVVFGEILADLFYDAPPVKEFRKKYRLSRVGGAKPLINAILKAYKDFGGKKKPRIAIVEFKQPFQTGDSQESLLLAGLLRDNDFEAEVVAPDQLDYRNDRLYRGDISFDLVYRLVSAHEFLLRFDLMHPLVRAYRERKVCIVNSFRSEVSRKRSLFHLLTDEEITKSFPAAERNAIKESIPWTRIVAQTKTTRGTKKNVDLPEYILKHRDKLILMPNDDSGEQQSYEGWSTDEAGWERALKIALRHPYVVQERVAPMPIEFPVDQYGDVVLRELNVDVQPVAFLGKVLSCSSRVSAASGFSTIAGMAPTFILEQK